MRLERLDGVRAIAVLLLILFQHSFMDLGWTGGELFFVLSGFLMTRILRATRTDRSYWSRFYVKRAVRILPLMLVILLCNKLATSHLSFAGMAGYALFLGDLAEIFDYTGGSLSGLSAISVGAHFVILWSVAVRFLRRGSLIAISLSLLAIEPLLRGLFSPRVHDFETYSSTPFHLDSIVAGSLLALLVEDPNSSRILARCSGWASAILALGFLSISHLFPWFIRATNTPIYNSLGYWTVAWIYFFFLAWVLSLSESAIAHRALSWAPLLYIAKISYALALVHPFVVAILKRVLHLPFGMEGEATNRRIFPLAIAISVPVCALILRYIQQPLHVWGEAKARRLRTEHGDGRMSEEELVSRETSIA